MYSVSIEKVIYVQSSTHTIKQWLHNLHKCRQRVGEESKFSMQWNIVRRPKRMECVWCNGNPVTLKTFIDFARKKAARAHKKSSHWLCIVAVAPLSVRQSRFMSWWWGWKVRWVTVETFRGLTTSKKNAKPQGDIAFNSLESYVSKFQTFRWKILWKLVKKTSTRSWVIENSISFKSITQFILLQTQQKNLATLILD